MKNIIVACLALTFLLGAALAVAQDKPAHAYVGSKACKTCHMGEKKGAIWEKWLETRHAKAMSTLDASKGQDKDPKCLKCHVVGFGAESGYKVEGLDAAMAAPEGLGAVGCESCHGPGADYKAMSVMKSREQAVAAGMLVPDEKVCITCHDVEAAAAVGIKIPPFNWAEMYPKIEHHIPEAAGQ